MRGDNTPTPMHPAAKTTIGANNRAGPHGLGRPFGSRFAQKRDPKCLGKREHRQAADNRQCADHGHAASEVGEGPSSPASLSKALYNKNSLAKPLSGGRPAMATEPIINAAAGPRHSLQQPAQLVDLARSRGLAYRPGAEKQQALEQRGLITCNRAPENPSTVNSRLSLVSPTMPSPRPIVTMPMFSILL